MTKTLAKALRVLAPALLLPLWSCGDDKQTIVKGDGGGDPGPTSPTGPAPMPLPDLKFFLGPANIAFTHRVGVTKCPQTLSTKLRFRNDGPNTLVFGQIEFQKNRVRVQEPSRRFSVISGYALDEDLKFNCGTSESFVEDLIFRILDEQTGKEARAKVKVTGTLQ